MACGLMNFIFQAKIICDHGDKFTVGRLAPIVLNGVAEVGIESVNVSDAIKTGGAATHRPCDTLYRPVDCTDISG